MAKSMRASSHVESSLASLLFYCLIAVLSVLCLEGLNEVRPSVYRAAMKLLSLQKLCYMHVVSLRQILPALRLVGGAENQEVGLSQEEVTQTVNRMFHSVSQEVPGHVTLQAPEQTCSLMYKLYDCDQTGCVSVRSLEVALIALSADTLSAKYKALVCVAERSSRERGTVRRSGLRSVLQDLSQVPVAVQEEGVFGCVEAAVRSCFNGVLTPSVHEEHVLSWLQSEPRLLLWLPTLYRLSVSQNVNHAVRCHSCSTFPITGLRYRCMKCVNLHLCQSCFLTDRQTKKHKTHHPVLEHCTQPTWRESLASLVHSARHALLPRRYTRREAERRRGLMWAEPGETQTRSSGMDELEVRRWSLNERDCAISIQPGLGGWEELSTPEQQLEDLPVLPNGGHCWPRSRERGGMFIAAGAVTAEEQKQKQEQTPLDSEQDRETLQWRHGLELGRLHQHHLGGPELRLAALRSDLTGGVVGEKRPPAPFPSSPDHHLRPGGLWIGGREAPALLEDVKNLQRDRWLLEKELQAWRVAVQSEQGILEDRCSEMRLPMETLRQHNLQLQGMVTQDPAGEVGLKAEEDYGICSQVELEEKLWETVERLKVSLSLQTDRCTDRQT
ncbi:LOW QUALITY PROTEIN: dystrotelin, partial [Centroberyx affinis]|uniref:LOW QUALITY PROTEIN: dystrotelin n=1 Tax=Centroberyx affinis TaxID=166261 RepID=UPI003A5C1692